MTYLCHVVKIQILSTLKENCSGRLTHGTVTVWLTQPHMSPQNLHRPTLNEKPWWRRPNC